MKPRNDSQILVTLDAKVLLGRIIRADFKAATLGLSEEGLLTDPDVILHTERYSWCPLFDQIDCCLGADGVGKAASDHRFERWLMYMDSSNLKNEMALGGSFFATPYGKAMDLLIEEGFSIEEPDGRLWHYTVFDMSASNARSGIVSFLADTGYGPTGKVLHIYDGLTRRLCLDIDFSELSREHPGSVAWNKYFAYRGLYLTTAKRVPASKGFQLTKKSVLVINANATGDMFIPCDVRRARTLSLDENGTAKAEFFTESAEDGGGISLKLFDGEGLIASDWAAHIRAAVFDEKPSGHQPSSFQIRMPFTKGVLHEVDFQGFIAETLDIDDNRLSELRIEDAYGIPRRISDVRMVLTTDMLKCHRWLKEWLELSPERSSEHTTGGLPDPIDYYFAKMRSYDHGLYVLSKRRRSASGQNGVQEITTNFQHLSTLEMSADDFDSFARRHFEAIGNTLFDREKAKALLLGKADTPIGGFYADDEEAYDRREGTQASEHDGISYALSKDERFIHDPHIRKQVADAVNAKLVDCASGKIPVRGTLRMLSQDLLAFLCMLSECTFATSQESSALSDGTAERASAAAERIGGARGECLDPQDVYLPHYDNPLNETGWLAVFRNPHMSRSEQCALRPVELEFGTMRERYLGHLDDVAMISCASPAPMVLGGADYDGDTVHIYDDAVIVEAVLRGAYVDPAAEDLRRRFPIADLSGLTDSDAHNTAGGRQRVGTDEGDGIGAHITSAQLFKSFQSNVGILSNSAFRLGTVLYGQPDDGNAPNGAGDGLADIAALSDDACANYTIAVGIDIDSVKTGVRLDMHDLLISGNKKHIEMFEVSGKMVPADLGFIGFSKHAAPLLRKSATPLWAYKKLDDSRSGSLGVYLRKGDDPTFRALDLGADLSSSDALKDASISNMQRLPWLMVEEAKRIRERADSPDFIDRESSSIASPFEELYPLLDSGVDRQKLRTIKALITAYQGAMWRLKVHEQRTSAAKNSKAFGKARRRAQEYPTRFSEEEIDSILTRAMLDIRDHFAADDGLSYDDALAAFAAQGFSDWALCPAEERPAALRKLFGGPIFSEDFYALMEDDALLNGFMIPFYLLGAAQAAETAQTRIEIDQRPKPEDHGGSSSFADDDGLSDDGLSDFEVDDDEEDSDYIRKDPQMYEELIAIINRHLRANSPKVAMRSDLVSILRERIKAALSPDDHLLDYLCVLKYENLCFSDRHYDSRALFWDLLAIDDLKEVLG